MVGLAEFADRPGAGAVRRAAAAGRAGPGAGAGAEGAAAGRAAEQPGRRAARPDARRDPRGAAAARHHHRVRHPRPGRGARRLRRGGRDERRPVVERGLPQDDLHLPAATEFTARFLGVSNSLPGTVESAGTRRHGGDRLRHGAAALPRLRAGRGRRARSACSCGRRASGSPAGSTADDAWPGTVGVQHLPRRLLGLPRPGRRRAAQGRASTGRRSASPTATRCSSSPSRRRPSPSR